MITPVVRRCPDGHWRRVIFDLAAFIADYPEQVMLSGIVQGWCPKYAQRCILLPTSLTRKFRCTAPTDDLDGPGGRRTRALHCLLCDTLSSDVLWHEYGIDVTIVVGLLFFCVGLLR